MSLLRPYLLRRTQSMEPPRVISDRSGTSPYLSRWYMIGKRRGEEEGVKDTLERYFNLFLHRFHRSDDDGALHNHPWAWSLSFVLVGGYWEEKRIGDRVVRRRVRPFTFNFIRGSDYHRVDLIEEDAWSLFLVGPRVSTWFFWDREHKEKQRWDLFIKGKDAWEQDRRET